VTLQLQAIRRRPSASEKFLRHDSAQVLEGREEEVKSLELRIERRAPKPSDEEVRIENVPAGRHLIGPSRRAT
jgi:hypothetical protein